MSISVISDLRWLNDQESHLITIDGEVLSLYEVFHEFDFTYNTSLMFSSALFSATIRQDHVFNFLY